MKVTFINPPIIDRRYNFTYSVDVPLGLAYLAAYVRENKIDVAVVDAVGEAVSKRRAYKKDYSVIGLTNSQIISMIDPTSDLIAISIRYSTQHDIVIDLIMEIKKNVNIPVVIGGNHATYSSKDFLLAGADYAILGEGETALLNLCKNLGKKSITGVITKTNKNFKTAPLIKDLDSLPFPARELFPLEKYFLEKSGQGPANKRFTAILTSRGCPNTCSFCASKTFWNQAWRSRSPGNIVDEIEYCINKHDITEYHISDDNFTLDKNRAKAVCNEILKRGLKIKWIAATGIRPEKIDFQLLKLMKKSGCSHITLAPESGSQKVLKEIYNKKIDLKRILEIIVDCNKIGIKTAAFIIIGAIGEESRDRKLTNRYVGELARAGLDELGVFPLVPYPECEISKKYAHIEIKNWEELTTGFVPDWYPNYIQVKNHKKQLYITFLSRMILYHPSKLVRLGTNFILGKQELKSDRVVKNMARMFIGK